MKTPWIITATALCLASPMASAGLYQPAPFVFDPANRVAAGDMYSVRISDNTGDFIGCGIRAYDNGFTTGFCQAGTGTNDGEFFTCFTDNPTLLEALKAISAFSFITFRWDADGNCTHIGNSTQSLYLPSWKDKK